MSALPQLLDGTLLPAGAAAAVYIGTIAAVALTAALARDPQRRRDARETLKVLLRRTNSR
ncbi:hypothetical protein ACWGF3_17745 [Streptomyces xanthophaeus]|uniref:Uncharacterized protein n=1 Tax=Streptomyces xanthophaeus TaxID=67385 RepID=A0A919LN97_9ACTN|nr:hypothetical protein [Streptomyces xanthophaeus]GHI90439.1 hypothetical protein Sxan_78030 [Streptomyces xanthophaeus]